MTVVFTILILLYNIFSFVLCNTQFVTLNYSAEFSGTVNNSIEFILPFNKTDPLTPWRVSVSSQNASRDYPLLIVVRKQRQVLSWQLPLLVDTKEGDLPFSNTSRTLCPDDIITKAEHYENSSTPSVSVSTASLTNVDFTLRIIHENSFHVEHDKTYYASISPSAPKIFYYHFPEVINNDTIDAADTVVLHIDSNDDVCMFASVQNNSCPVYDLEHDIRFEGFWETVSRRGGMTIPRSKFPNGFFLVLVPKSDDHDCTASTGLADRNKRVRFSIVTGASRRDYFTAVLVTACIAVACHAIAWILLCVVSRKRTRLPMTMESIDAIIDDAVAQATDANLVTPTSTLGGFDEFLGEDDSSMDETEYDTITEAESERHIFRTKSVLYVSDLARKSARILQRKSYLYLWHVITVAVFYGLPVVQLVVTYQRVLAETGNQDLCYYNFLCAHPLGLLSDFNHVFSNIGYVVLGILFLLLVQRRERWHEDAIFDRHYGIPQHHGLFYAMGFALIMEGVLSASYHVCPNHTNFQFDSSFMYVMAVLCMVKIYQNRHPDINATAYATFGVLAVAICLGMIGILAGTVYFWAAFTILHLATCLLLTVQIYYMGCWKCDRGAFMRVFRTLANDFRSGPVNVIKPVYKGRMVLLVLGNVCNWALAIVGLYHHERDFATYLLAIFMSNTLLYTIFYIVMKILHKERIMFPAIMFIILATLSWAAAMYFFIHKSISWALTPAESRQYNQPCLLLNFYDPHDIWHFLSAFAMFFSFMILLTLDDDLTHTQRTRINVF